MGDLLGVQITSFLILLVSYSVIEYLLQKHFHPKETTWTSFLITKDYLIAYACGIIELLIGHYFFPVKSSPSNPLFWIGICMIISGLYVRFSAIIHAGVSFTHLIAFQKKPEHILVTDGIYKYFRHPSYFGFFVFAVGTQVFFSNPICICGFCYVLYKFFSRRIQIEERYLIDFFGNDYIQYKAKTPTMIPFIK